MLRDVTNKNSQRGRFLNVLGLSKAAVGSPALRGTRRGLSGFRAHPTGSLIPRGLGFRV